MKKESGELDIVITKVFLESNPLLWREGFNGSQDQDPIVDAQPVFGIDMWEHAYYLQVSSNMCLVVLVANGRLGNSISTIRRHTSWASGMSSTGRSQRGGFWNSSGD